ncbi:hypothetical protein KGY79_12425 [Candidatus Bipolaricaulota bacterium]|nr:hypothetical protein [Candidatus Bipolaricaulota bacterium]
MKKYLFTFVLISLLVASFSVPSFGLSTGDLIFRLSTPAGEASTHQLTIRGKEGRLVTLSVEDWLYGEDGENIYLPKNSVQWVLDEGLAKGEKAELVYRISNTDSLSEKSLKVKGKVRADNKTCTSENETLPDTPSDEKSTSICKGGDLPVGVERTVKRIEDRETASFEITLQLIGKDSVHQVKITEQFSQHVNAEPLKKSGSTFYSVNRSCADWVDFKQDEFNIPSSGEKTVEFDFSVPENAEGSYWCGVVATAKTGEGYSVGVISKVLETTPSATDSYVSKKVPFSAVKSSCYDQVDMTKAEFLPSEIEKECISDEWLEENEVLKDSKSEEEKAKKEVKLDKFDLVETNPLEFVISLNNTGKLFARPSGFLKVFDEDDKLVVEKEVKVGVTLPGYSRKVYLKTDEKAKLGEYKASLNLETKTGVTIESSFSFKV